VGGAPLVQRDDDKKRKKKKKPILRTLRDRGSRVQFPAGAGNIFLHCRVQNGSWAHPTSYPMGTGGSFPGGKSVGK
jgi:hypothetical protein